MISNKSIIKIRKYLPLTIYYLPKFTKIIVKKFVKTYCPIWVRNYF